VSELRKGLGLAKGSVVKPRLELMGISQLTEIKDFLNRL
jgi:hypothetical protein